MLEGATLDSFAYQFQPPLELAQFIAEQDDLDYETDSGDIFLYHGTNCYRRWEIKRCGVIEPGRNHYSFFCTKVNTALTFARAACLRDMTKYSANSLICEPVVLKVRFNPRIWLQVDFWHALSAAQTEVKSNLSLAILGPISTDFIVEVLHCNHNRRFVSAAKSISSFANDTVFSNIQQLREKLTKRRPDAWALKQLGGLSQNVTVRLAGGTVPELTFSDNLRRIRQTS